MMEVSENEKEIDSQPLSASGEAANNINSANDTNVENPNGSDGAKDTKSETNSQTECLEKDTGHSDEKVNADSAVTFTECETVASSSMDAPAEDDGEDKDGDDDNEKSDGTSLHQQLCPRETDFTSEIFKIEIMGLPRRFGFKELKRRLTVTLQLRPHKMKALASRAFAFVCFSCEEDREAALKAINGHIWKGRQLVAKKAKPATDPMKKRKHDDSSDCPSDIKRQKVDDDIPPSTRLKSSVTPLWEVPYSEQLEQKASVLKDMLKAVACHGDVRSQFVEIRKQNDGMCCPLLPINPSPVLDGYRNKSEFSIGYSEPGGEPVVGFRFGLYKDGSDGVGSPSEISIVSDNTKMVVKCFQDFIRSRKYIPFDHRTHNGHWRQLTVRNTREGGGTMAIAEFVVNNVPKADMEAEKEAIKEYFTQGCGQEAKVTTFFFRPCSTRTSNSVSEEPYELIYGDGHIQESLLGMKFRVSPSAFFQVNTAAAEKLYKLIGDWCQASPTTTLLDICCGTGTIGLTLAKRVSQVIGIEMCPEAIEDAKVNAELNGVTNCKYHCARVQDVIQDVTSKLYNTDVVAILDPPRAGLNPKVIHSLRASRNLHRIVYAACHPHSAKMNFIDLLRPSSRKLRGEPFRFVKAMPVDMFPHTKHCELLALFERHTPTAPKPSTEQSD